ncbi:hypothetical protein [Luteimonas sp. RC10]|uniref:major capsid protein n=1 Tax=Luteimonas sp. RC10 TaxID=2587035 RepID=UPI001621EF67|nr:hypothetical protein [Luteimonas sp. RC10]MBB3344515.1 prolyl-tRNA editing enzyme YbaK/EbsC (Cys-tRNA(Pro) deacylase) [Luteimonas sp. RC10]
MRTKLHSLGNKLAVAVVATAPFAAFAQQIDTSAAVETIGIITGGITAVGVAKFAPAAIAVAYKWVKAAIFG